MSRLRVAAVDDVVVARVLSSSIVHEDLVADGRVLYSDDPPRSAPLRAR